MMSRTFLLESDMIFGANEAVVELKHEIIPALALEVSLLLERLVESLRLKSISGKWLTVTVSKESAVGKAKAWFKSNDELVFECGRNQAEYLYSVLLRAYRDEAAEVSHIHLEGILDDRLFDVTFLFNRFRDSLSEEMARKLLSDD